MSSLIFQAIDWQTKTVRDKTDPEITKTEIYVFGKTKDKEDVYLEITDFIFSTSFLYVSFVHWRSLPL